MADADRAEKKYLKAMCLTKSTRLIYDAVNIVFTLLEEGRQNKISKFD